MHRKLCMMIFKPIKLTRLKFCVDIIFYIFLFKLHLWNMDLFIFNWAVAMFSLT
jgi:hypothetical protein